MVLRQRSHVRCPVLRQRICHSAENVVEGLEKIEKQGPENTIKPTSGIISHGHRGLAVSPLLLCPLSCRVPSPAAPTPRALGSPGLGGGGVTPQGRELFLLLHFPTSSHWDPGRLSNAVH